MFNNIVVVCVGNICRSPMAEALLAHGLASREEVKVSSAGLGALVGEPADPLAQALMEEAGLDISAHRARQLSPLITREADLILVMEPGHREAVAKMDVSARGKCYLLGHWEEGLEVADPYRKPREAFEQALRTIERGVNGWVARLG
ncbi:phosphotyrosine protein phosphatase [Alkalilimnicola ehrlichii]|uniref:protein-tyrosine-phosphatase n=1 Tax=Alkalilimnicola ehrlichii TaxID=351052 RepID=A0A3E0WN38_9GAMM|nr:low molecular weight protein-tyrosine-phosphatase [Alkalilimnicola ehrlichii]RFA26405.1 phosphotyrosine protein phosphatase [Alkalilimnicola ehrlichii]RFA33467.1 phosphotyrosine protein phosphatase [Alkalilimnicola ehrlichii]